MMRQKTENGRQKTDCRVPLRGTLFQGRGIAATTLLSSVFCPLSSVAAEVARPAYVPPPAVSSSGILQIIVSLILVLAAIILVAWLLKRMNMAQHGAGQQIKVLGGVPIGQRERIVLVEVADTWLVVGVGPGQIRTLHTLQKTEDGGQKTEESSSGSMTPANKFSSLLASVLKQRKQGAGK